MTARESDYMKLNSQIQKADTVIILSHAFSKANDCTI